MPGSTTRPVGTTSGRISREPTVTSTAVPTDRSAETVNTAGSEQPNPSIRIPARTGPAANPIGPEAPKMAIVVPSRAFGVTSRIPASITPVLPELEPDQQHRQRELPRLARQGDAGEDDRLHEGAADDHHLAAVLVGPGTPQRHERGSDHEDQGVEQADERQAVGRLHAHVEQVGR